jgi:hypothetical protein
MFPAITGGYPHRQTFLAAEAFVVPPKRSVIGTRRSRRPKKTKGEGKVTEKRGGRESARFSRNKAFAEPDFDSDPGAHVSLTRRWECLRTRARQFRFVVNLNARTSCDLRIYLRALITCLMSCRSLFAATAVTFSQKTGSRLDRGRSIE